MMNNIDFPGVGTAPEPKSAERAEGEKMMESMPADIPPWGDGAIELTRCRWRSPDLLIQTLHSFPHPYNHECGFARCEHVGFRDTRPQIGEKTDVK